MSAPEHYSGPERRKEAMTWREEVDRRFSEGSVTINGLREDVDENTRITREMHADTKEIVEFFRSVKGAFKVLEWIGRLAKPLGYIVALGAAVLGLWTAAKGGGVPK